MQCAFSMERTARSVLQGLGRSCHLRLHSSHFLHLLEDIPLRTHVVSCSIIQVDRTPLLVNCSSFLNTAIAMPVGAHQIPAMVLMWDDLMWEES